MERKKMKIKLGYNMGYAGTNIEWEEEVPKDMEDSIENYLEDVRDSLYNEACEKISIWAEIVE